MNDTVVGTGVSEMIESMLAGVRELLVRMVSQADAVRTPVEAAELARQFRTQGLDQMRLIYQGVLQRAVDAGDGGRQCPHCQQRRRHKGLAPLKLLTSVGEVCVQGVSWRCDGCGRQEHAGRRVSTQWITGPMRELVCLLGVTQSSFAHASAAMEKLLGARLSAPAVAATSREEGRRMAAAESAAPRPVSGTPGGQLRRADGEHPRGTVEAGVGLPLRRRQGPPPQRGDARAGGPVLPAAAPGGAAPTGRPDQAVRLRLRRRRVHHAGVAEFLPEAMVHVIDIYHAYQHVHEAARLIHGEGTPAAAAWAKQWCDELFLSGGAAVRKRLSHARFSGPTRQAALNALRDYLQRNAGNMDYPTYRREGLPISSGPMESTCKQLGLRIKGPGMRWNKESIDPMAELISQWCDRRWDQRWKNAA